MQVSKKIIKEKIITDITTMILQGVLHKGDFLPSIRVMSSRYKVSRGTVMLVYKYLESMGYIQGFERSGYLVTGPITSQKCTSGTVITSNTHHSVSPILSATQHYQKLLDRQPCLIPLHFVKRWMMNQEKPLINRQPFSTDNLLRFLTLSRGISAENQQLLLFPGRQEALTLLALFLRTQQANPTIILEDPCDSRVCQLFVKLSFNVMKVPVDQQGLQVDKLPRVPNATLLCMPSLQFPTAARMSEQRRAHLYQWAELHQATIIEDDSYSMLGFGQDKTAPLCKPSAKYTSFYLTQLHELTGLSYNLSLIIAPTQHVVELSRLQQWVQSTSYPNSFSLVDAFLGSSYFMKYLTALLDERHQKQLLAINKIKECLPLVELNSQSFGGFCYFTLPTNFIPHSLINRCFFLCQTEKQTKESSYSSFIYPFTLFHLNEIERMNRELSTVVEEDLNHPPKILHKKSPQY